MTVKDIVNELAKNKTIETLIQRIQNHKLTNEEMDLCQDLYLTLLTKNKEKTIELYNKNQLNYFLCGMIRNQLFSKTSQYFRDYRKFNYYSTNIDDLYNI